PFVGHLGDARFVALEHLAQVEAHLGGRPVFTGGEQAAERVRVVGVEDGHLVCQERVAVHGGTVEDDLVVGQRVGLDDVRAGHAGARHDLHVYFQRYLGGVGVDQLARQQEGRILQVGGGRGDVVKDGIDVGRGVALRQRAYWQRQHERQGGTGRQPPGPADPRCAV